MGPTIDVEEFLGVEDGKGVGWGGADCHFARRHSVGFEYFSLERSGGVSDTFSPPIQISDIFIEGGAIDTFYNTTVSRLTYGYSIDGSITEIDADVTWQPREHFGFGAGFRYFKTSVEGANSSLNGEFDFEYIGPTFYVHVTF